jgi:uncharacterized SAM-binding protein YcdF (DUF218 family)
MFYYLSKAFWDFAAPSRILELSTIAACCWAIVGSRRARLVAATTAAMLIFIGILPIGSWLLIPLEARFPAWRSASPTPVDGIIALGGDTGHRIEELARLSRLFPQVRLVYSGRGDRHAAEIEIRRAGLDPSRVIIESSSRTTFENAVESAQIVKPTPAEHWLLITSGAHMPRAVGCFRNAGFHVTADPVDFHTDSSSFMYAATVVQRVAQLDDAAREWIGLLAYGVIGYTNALFPAP